MAGALKHMERSHRSKTRNGYSVFNQFHRNAYKAATQKQQRQTLGQKLASMFREQAKGVQ